MDNVVETRNGVQTDFAAGTVLVELTGNATDATVSRISPTPGAAVRSIPVGNGPTAVAVHHDGVWVANRLDGTVSRINAASDARFYLYSVCELPKATLERLERDEHFTLSPTGDGAFSVAANGRYYLEYISLTKLLEDAQARNQAFFQKLGLEA